MGAIHRPGAGSGKGQAHLQSQGIPTAVHYPIPMHAQKAFAHLGGKDADCPEASRAAREVISLPMHGMMAETQIDAICRAVKEVV
jgi:UDP-2-acetamido-2-deoxy-ribo-hexuluronate aminotransferase